MMLKEYELVISEIDHMQAETVDLLCSMVRIPSINPPGDYKNLVEFLQRRLSQEGLDTEIIEVPNGILAKHSIEVNKYNFLGTYSGKYNKPILFLNAHLDTVSAECVPGDLERWTIPPFEGIVKEGRVWGRGACDSKGRLSAYITAVLAIIRSGIKVKGKIIIAATADEETGLSEYTGAGYLASIDKLRGDYAIIEGMSYEVNYANQGSIVLRITTHGDSLHTSQLQEHGINANHTMVYILSDLLDYQEELKRKKSIIPNMGHTILNIGHIMGGLSHSMTASKCTIDVGIAPIPDQNIIDIISFVRQRLENLKTKHSDLMFELELVRTVDPAVSLRDSKLAMKLSETSLEISGKTLPINGLTGRTDLLYFIKAGMQAVNFGPGRLFESNLHLPDENIRISDLLETSKIIAITALKLLNDN